MEILKLGGSIVTHKDKPFTANNENIKRLAKEISHANPKDLIIVHGGGSFGHSIAKEYDIANGYKKQEQLVGFSKTRQKMIELNNIIVESLLKEKIAAVSVSPSSFIQTDAKRIKSPNLKLIKKFLEEGFVPVLYGDAVLDDSQKFAILSGDQLVTYLAVKLRANKIILGTDVDGIFTANPKLNQDAKLFEAISIKEIEKINLAQSLHTDVTGGMLGKIIEATRAIEMGIKVIIVNAGAPNRIYKALKGEPVTGTKLKK
jgi:isopentenyl phosphate kinase